MALFAGKTSQVCGSGGGCGGVGVMVCFCRAYIRDVLRVFAIMEKRKWKQLPGLL